MSVNDSERTNSNRREKKKKHIRICNVRLFSCTQSVDVSIKKQS